MGKIILASIRRREMLLEQQISTIKWRIIWHWRLE